MIYIYIYIYIYIIYKLLTPYHSFFISYLNILLSKPLLADVCLPMHIILSPMEKRFRYHFCGTQKTNRVDMPEWYMSQVLQWIRANDYFLTVVDRDFISVTNESAVSVRLELMRGLVTLLLDKLNYDLGLSTSMPLRFNHKFSSNNYSDCNIPFEVCYPSFHSNSDDELLNNAQHFSHLIDVVLQTDSKLSKMMYPSDYPRPSDVLSHPKVFSRWLLLEQHLASDRLKIALRSSSSWFVVDESEGRPQCVDYFIAILHAISSRGRQLSDKVSQARFVQVQLNLIHEFYFECVVSLARGQPELDASMNRSPYSKSKTEKGNETSNVFRSLFSSHGRSLNSQPRTKKASVINQLFKCFVDGVEDPRSSRWILTMNAMKCLHDVMLEWANDQHYVTFWEDLSTRRLLQFGDPWLKDIGLNTYKTNIMASELKEHESQNEAFNESCSSDTYLGLHGGVFTQMLLLYSSQIKRMLEETVKVVLKDLKEKSSLYIRSSDNWLCDTSESGHLGNIKSENANLMMSTNASVFFHALHDWLYHLSISVHWKLFSHVWKSIASQLDDYFYNELILMNRFTSLGAAQLRFDLTNCLYSLFNLYTERPESFFSQTRDACVLLNLLPGTAELLKDTLNESVSTVRKDDNNPLGSLLELGVYRLTPEEALRILSLRVIVG
uniref:RAD50-interacting protein 1 n=1 Tax=Trichobilharzia regenti TaxID=157069 RepID=A0AA85JI44_TRIRE|nr:unnamed protein product [Trichobilharzia regenti]